MLFDDHLTRVVTGVLGTGRCPALIGPPGIGKSAWVADLARHLGTEAFVLPCNQLAEKADLTGARLVPSADGGDWVQRFYPHEVVTAAVDHARAHPDQTPILFLDEINRTTADVTSAVLTLVTLRRLGHVVLPDNLRLIVAGNDHGHVTALDRASVSRFVLLRVEPDVATFTMVMGADLHPWVARVLAENPALLTAGDNPGDNPDVDVDVDVEPVAWSMDWDMDADMLTQTTCPRTIAAVSAWLCGQDVDDLRTWVCHGTGQGQAILAEVVHGFVGDTGFARALLAVAAEELSTTVDDQATDAGAVVEEPAVFASLAAASDRGMLARLVDGLSDDQRAEALVYALTRADRPFAIIDALAGRLTVFPMDYQRRLITVLNTQTARVANVERLLAAGAGNPVVAALEPIVAVFL